MLTFTLTLPLKVSALGIGNPTGSFTAQKDLCNTTEYYSAFRTEADTAINASFDASVNEVHADNQANMEANTKAAVDNLRRFAQAQFDACDAYYKTCSGKDDGDVSNVRFQANSCIQEARNRIELAKNMTSTAVMMNANRKARMTVTEKFKAIGHRYKTIPLVLAGEISQSMSELSSKASFLRKETMDIDGAKLQDAWEVETQSVALSWRKKSSVYGRIY